MVSSDLQVLPKPSKAAQQREALAQKVLLSDVFATLKRKLFRRDWAATDLSYAGFMAAIHGLCLLAPFTFSWPMFSLFVGLYAVTGCLGITLSFHRQLSHRSFVTPKWLEYALAYCGVMAVQGEPIEWASSHRYHHLHTDTPLDPHSPYEGFWWSHMGWLLDNEVLARPCNHSISSSLAAFWLAQRPVTLKLTPNLYISPTSVEWETVTSLLPASATA